MDAVNLVDMEAPEWPEGGDRSRAQRGPAGPAGLPCQNSNNSNGKLRKYRLKPIPGQAGFWRDPNNKRAFWEQLDEDTLQRFGVPTGAEAKSAFHLRRNVEAFVTHWGRDHCLFFTLTDEANLHPTQFAKRWNSFLVRNGSWILSFIRALEPQKQGRPHYHLLVAVLWDTRPDEFDWPAFDECQQERRANGPTARFRELRARYKASAAPELVALWSLLRKVLPRYGLGRAELLPLRKGREAVAEYIGKYLEAGLILRKHSWKGCRRVEFDRRAKIGWLACTRAFAWYSPGAIKWRQRLRELADVLGVPDMDAMRQRFGPKWAYRLRETLTLSDDQKWSELLAALADYLAETGDAPAKPVGRFTLTDIPLFTHHVSHESEPSAESTSPALFRLAFTRRRSALGFAKSSLCADFCHKLWWRHGWGIHHDRRDHKRFPDLRAQRPE